MTSTTASANGVALGFLSQKARTATFAAAIVVAMTALGFAAVPLYDIFCRVTGFDGTPQRAAVGEVGESIPVLTGQTISVRYDANVSPQLPWRFRPETIRDDITIGARDMAIYSVQNLSGRDVVGTASFNVTPLIAAQYFVKIECFCYSEQTVAAGETLRMPVLFYIDPAIVNDPEVRDVEEITLSYTFHRVDNS